MRGQVSNELLVVVGFILIILIPLLYIMFFEMEALQTELFMLQVHFSVARIAFLINAIGYMGDGSAMITEIYVPPAVDDVSIGRNNDHEVVFTLLFQEEKNEIVQPTIFPIEIGTGTNAPSFTDTAKGGGRYRVEMKNVGGIIVLSKQPSSKDT